MENMNMNHLLNPPKRSRSRTSTKSTSSTSSKKSTRIPLHNDLLGINLSNISLASPSSLKLQKAPSISSSSSGSSLGSIKSLTSITSSKSSTSAASSYTPKPLTTHDLFGVKIPPTEEELAPARPDGVELSTGTYKVPEPIDKQFYSDLTVLDDEELVGKYGLIKIRECGGKNSVEEEKRRGSMTYSKFI